MRGNPVRFLDFSGGLNTKVGPYLLEENQARDLLNVQSLVQGGIVKRDGLVTFCSPGEVLSSLYPLEAVGPLLIGAGTGNKLYSMTSGGVATVRKSGLTTGLGWEWVQTQVSGGQGPLFGMNGVDTPQQWDGSAGSMSNWTASSGSVPNGKYCLLHQNYVFVAGVSANPSRLYWCNIAAGTGTDARDWPAANVIDLDPNDGDQITGLGKAGPLLLVFKRRKIFAVYDPSTGANRRISDSVGCVSHRSISETPGGTFFLGETGVWRTNGSTVDPTPVSTLVAPTLALNASPEESAGVYWDSHYYLSFSTDGTANNVTLDYDLRLQSWWYHSIGSNQFAVWHPSDPGLYSAKATSAKVDHCFVPGISQDNGSNFRWFWKGPWLSPSYDRRRIAPTPDYRKRIRQIRCDGSGTVDFSLAKDFVGSEVLIASDIFATDLDEDFGSGTFGEGTFGGGTTVPLARLVQSGAVARALSPVFGATSSAPAAVYSLVLAVTDRRT